MFIYKDPLAFQILRAKDICSDHADLRDPKISECRLYAKQSKTDFEQWSKGDPDYPKGCFGMFHAALGDLIIWNPINKEGKRNAKAQAICVQRM